MASKHGGSRVECDVCGKHFGNRSLMLAHRRELHLSDEARMVECNVCGFKSRGIRNLRKHEKLHSEPADKVLSITPSM